MSEKGRGAWSRACRSEKEDSRFFRNTCSLRYSNMGEEFRGLHQTASKIGQAGGYRHCSICEYLF